VLDKQFGRACLHGRAIYFSEETQTLRIGSSGRTRTYNPPVNSRFPVSRAYLSILRYTQTIKRLDSWGVFPTGTETYGNTYGVPTKVPTLRDSVLVDTRSFN